MNTHASIKPDWATRSDREIDLSDMWIDYVDPQNEDGALVTGHMSRERVLCCDTQHRDFRADGFHLDGVSVDDGTGVLFFDRTWLLGVMGHSAIWKIEEHEMEAA